MRVFTVSQFTWELCENSLSLKILPSLLGLANIRKVTQKSTRFDTESADCKPPGCTFTGVVKGSRNNRFYHRPDR